MLVLIIISLIVVNHFLFFIRVVFVMWLNCFFKLFVVSLRYLHLTCHKPLDVMFLVLHFDLLVASMLSKFKLIFATQRIINVFKSFVALVVST